MSYPCEITMIHLSQELWVPIFAMCCCIVPGKSVNMGPVSKINTVFPDIGLPTIKIRRL